MHRLPQVGDVVSLQPYASSEWIVNAIDQHTYKAYNADNVTQTCSWQTGIEDKSSNGQFIPLTNIHFLDKISPSKVLR